MPDPIISQFKRAINAPLDFDRQVESVMSRDAIPGDVRWEGMLVRVKGGQTYELQAGLTNADWTPFTGIPEAPQDGNLYGRLNASWQPITGGGGGGQVIKSTFTGVSVVGTVSNEPLDTIVLPAGTLANNGDFIKITAIASLDSTSGQAQLKLIFNGNSATTFNFVSLTSLPIRRTIATLYIKRSSATSIQIASSRDLGGGTNDVSINSNYTAITNLDSTSNILDLATTLTNASCDATLHNITYELFNV